MSHEVELNHDKPKQKVKSVALKSKGNKVTRLDISKLRRKL